MKALMRCLVWIVSLGTTALMAPEPSVMSEALVGVTWQGYYFQSPTRFDWSGEGGNWSYQKTGPDGGLLIFTYDEDGNDPGAYREEVVLVFETASSGTYRYSEYVGGIEDPGSVVGSSIDFTFLLDLSPTVEAMAARLVGRTWEGYVFTTETRFGVAQQELDQVSAGDESRSSEV